MPVFNCKAADAVFFINPLPGEVEEQVLPGGKVIHAQKQVEKIKFKGHTLNTDELPEHIRDKAVERIRNDPEFGVTLTERSSAVQEEIDKEADLARREQEVAARENAVEQRELGLKQQQASPVVQAADQGEKNAKKAEGATPPPPQAPGPPPEGKPGTAQSPLLENDQGEGPPEQPDKYEAMDFHKLRQECKTMNLPAGGNAEQLKKRLREADKANG